MLKTDVGKLRRCFWHRNLDKADQKLRQILVICRIVVPQTAEFGTRLERLDYRTREFIAYALSNKSMLIPYGRAYRRGKIISSAMAESAVIQVINARMCKRQQMRWSPRGRPTEAGSHASFVLGKERAISAAKHDLLWLRVWFTAQRSCREVD